MEITAEKIQSNWDDFLKVIDTYISSPRKEKLIAFYKKYEDRFVLMPASHKVQYHNCFPGGYIDHVLRVVEYTVQICKMWEGTGAKQTFTMEEAVFSAINHDLGKFGTPEEEAYIPQTDEWRKNKLNEAYSYNNKIEFMSVPDRSLYLLQTHGVEYNKTEFLSIKLHDGIYDEANKPYLLGWLPEQKPRTALVHLLHFADMMAARFEFEREYLPKFAGEVKTPAPLKISTTKAEKTTKVLKEIGAKGKMDDAVKNFFSK